MNLLSRADSSAAAGDSFMSDAVSGYDQLLTLGELARRLGESQSRIKYAVGVYQIEPATRVGILRCWQESDLPRIQGALTRIAKQRGDRL